MIRVIFAPATEDDEAGFRSRIRCGRQGCPQELGSVWLPPHGFHAPPHWMTEANWMLDDDADPRRYRKPRPRGHATGEMREAAFPDRVDLPAVVECPRCRTVQSVDLPA